MNPVRSFRLRTFLLVLLASAQVAFALAWAADTATEPAVRAALLFNFMKFTQWPAGLGSSQHLQVCIATSDAESHDAMEALNARLVRNRPVLVTRFRQQTDCDVIYVDARSRWNAVQDVRNRQPALTVGGYPGFLADGGMIELSIQDGAPRFEISQTEAKRAGLRFYPQLLQLARRIVE
jgi:hypothetical protein